MRLSPIIPDVFCIRLMPRAEVRKVAVGGTEINDILGVIVAAHDHSTPVLPDNG